MPLEVSNPVAAPLLPKPDDNPQTVIAPPRLPAAPNQSAVWTPFSPEVEREIAQGWQTMARNLRSTSALAPLINDPAARVRFEDNNSVVLDGNVGKVDRDGMALNRQYVSTVWDACHKLLPNASRTEIRALVEALTFDSYAHELQHVDDAKKVEQICGRPNVRFGMFKESEQSAHMTELLAVREIWSNPTPALRSALTALTSTRLPAAIEVSERVAALASFKQPEDLAAHALKLVERPNILSLGANPDEYMASVKTELTRIDAIQGSVRTRLGEAEKTLANLDAEEKNSASPLSPLAMLANRQKRNAAASDIQWLSGLDTYSNEVRGDTQPLLNADVYPALRGLFDGRVREATEMYRRLSAQPR